MQTKQSKAHTQQLPPDDDLISPAPVTLGSGARQLETTLKTLKPLKSSVGFAFSLKIAIKTLGLHFAFVFCL